VKGPLFRYYYIAYVSSSHYFSH